MKIEDQLRLLKRNTTYFVDESELKEKIQSGKQLRVKLGVDPTASDVTLGWAVVFRKLKEFQDLGHHACLIIGDFTAQIGDPSGKSKTRPQLTSEQVSTYANSVLDKIFKIIDKDKTTVYFNSEWLGSMKLDDFIRLASKVTVARILERDDFSKRLKEEKPISLHEMIYPMCQAYDSVKINADIELGGNDQLFNNLLGRTLMSQMGMSGQCVMLSHLLVGTDGKEKMSQSLGNYVSICDDPNTMFGKAMSIPDSLIINWMELTTVMSQEEIDTYKNALNSNSINPRDAKIALAKSLVMLYHGKGQSLTAEEYFINTFSAKKGPTEVEEKQVPQEILEGSERDIIALLVSLGFSSSRGSAKRLIESGAVSIDGEKLTTFNFSGELDGKVLKVGKHRFCKLIN